MKFAVAALIAAALAVAALPILSDPEFWPAGPLEEDWLYFSAAAAFLIAAAALWLAR
jgi:hypothetical protein